VPGGDVRVIDETTVALDESGGNARLGDLVVYVEAGTVGPDGAELTQARQPAPRGGAARRHRRG